MGVTAFEETAVGAIPNDWEVRSLKDISPRQGVGLVINPSTYFDRRGNVPLLVGSHVQEGRIDADGANQITEASNDLLAASRLSAGDLVTVRVGEPGLTAVVPPELDGCNCASLMIIRGHSTFDSRWLCAAMNSAVGRKQVEHVQYGTAQKVVNIGDAVGFVFAVPPLREQVAIAEALGDVDALLDGLDGLIAKKRDLRLAAMQQLLTGQTRLPGFRQAWDVKRLRDLGFTYGGLAGKTKADFGQGAASYIPFMSVMKGVAVDLTQCERVRIGPGESQNAVARGDLFFNGSSETSDEVGLCAVLLDEPSDVFLNSFCFGFRFHEPSLADGLYFAYFFRSGTGRELLRALAQGAIRYNLSKAALLALELPLPARGEQIAVAEVLSDMDTELEALEARREKTRLLKQGMMQELLTGRIRLV